MSTTEDWNDVEVERWFIHRAVPHLIPNYSATEDIFTRTFPFLATVMLGQLFLTFTPDSRGWRQAGWFAIGLALFVAALAGVNRLRGRSLFAVPDDIGILELAAFVVVPPLLRTIATGNLGDFVTWALVNLGLLGVAYVITSYGLFPMVPWALRQVVTQISQIVDLFAKSLPLLLLFSAFLFVNAEIWQVANDIPWAYFAIVIGFIVAIGCLFISVTVRPALDGLNDFSSWDEVNELASASPVANAPTPDTALVKRPLDRGQRLNLGLLLFVAQGIQVLLVALMVAGFYVLFGLLTVREATILQWTTADTVTSYATIGLLGDEMVLSKPLVLVTGIIAAFSGLQFAVSVVTDETYRREFAEDINREIRESLAVRCRYAAGKSMAGGAESA